MKTIEIDIETFSSIDLRRAGVYKYAEAPDFEILLFAYSVDGGEIKVVDMASGENLPEKISEALQDPDVTKWAFNSQFERICLSRWLGLPEGKYLDPRSWKCSLVWSAYMGLPLSLEGVGAVLELKNETNGKGPHSILCTPCRPTIQRSRTRNLPAMISSNEQFKIYNAGMWKWKWPSRKIGQVPVPNSVWEEFHLIRR